MSKPDDCQGRLAHNDGTDFLRCERCGWHEYLDQAKAGDRCTYAKRYREHPGSFVDGTFEI